MYKHLDPGPVPPASTGSPSSVSRAGPTSRFDVLGISWGGALAQQIAFQNPRRCRRLVLVSTTTGCAMVPARPRVLARMATSRRR
jgi:pimeloyl-ACP methyl ester carboxylesterase